MPKEKSTLSPNSRLLVTGGAGFIGSNLCRRLLTDGYEVACLDDLSTGKYNNIKNLLKNPSFEFFNHDLTKPFFPDRIDAIFNLACPASPNHYQLNPIKTAKTIFLGTNNMLELAKSIGAKFFLSSSSEVYGDPMEHPQTEDYKGSVNTTGLRSCYNEGKRLAETLCADYQRVHGVDVRIMRMFNTYGPNMRPDDGRVISNFIVQALTNKKMTIYGNGKQTRSFCYVDDMIKGMILLMSSNYYKPINLGNPKELSIIELAYLIKGLINQNLEFEFKELPEDDPKKRRPCIKKAINHLNWEPKIELKDGLSKTIEWFKENLEI